MATSQRFEPPHFDCIEVRKKGKDGKEENLSYYFNISEMLHQYFEKHPTEIQQATEANQNTK